MEKKYIQITSGRGPVECARAVALVLEKILEQASEMGLHTEVIERESGPVNRTLLSAVITVYGDESERLIKDWEGTVQWISKSPYRIHHQRKNWFVGVSSCQLPENSKTDESAIRYETLRASGPGGQHVNKTESAVRAIHSPSGLSVVASDRRSQLQNKQLAKERLLQKITAWNVSRQLLQAQQNWSNHNSLQRGNPVKTITERMRN